MTKLFSLKEFVGELHFFSYQYHCMKNKRIHTSDITNHCCLIVHPTVKVVEKQWINELVETVLISSMGPWYAN